jgi:hypothetical protein
MIETTLEVTTFLDTVLPVLPEPVAVAVTAINATATACTAIGAFLDVVDGWDWPW